MRTLIRLSRKRILYDIANNAFVTAETMTDEANRHWAQDIIEHQNIDRVNRVLWLAYMRVGHMLRRYLQPVAGRSVSIHTPPLVKAIDIAGDAWRQVEKSAGDGFSSSHKGRQSSCSPSCSSSAGDGFPTSSHTGRPASCSPSERDEYVFCLVSRRPIDSFTADYCGILIEELMVDTAITDWLEITAPEKAAVWALRRDDALARLRQAIATLHPHPQKRMEII